MMKLVFIICSLFALKPTSISNENTGEIETPVCEGHYLDINSIVVYEIEETVELGFNTKDYLPKNFNPLKGKGDIDWCSVTLFEIEEEVEIAFNTKSCLPENFNPLKGKIYIDWSLVELFEIEEEVELEFNTKDYLPENFNPYNGMG